MMPRTLKVQALLYALALAWLAGGTLAVFGYLRISRAMQDEATAQVQDMVTAASRLLEDERFWVDRDGIAEGWAGVRTRECGIEEIDDPDLRALAEQADGQPRAVGVLSRPGSGLWIICVEQEQDGRLTITECPLRGAHHLTDQLRDQIFNRSDMDTESATVTIFEGPRRIATNVRKDDGSRAVDTFVSEPVAQRCLMLGMPFNDRAWVVNRWVITCYLPIRSPTGEILGMLYAGIDEEQYLARGRSALWTFLMVILVITALVTVNGIWFGRRMYRPLTDLTTAAVALAEGRYELPRHMPQSPEEIRILAEAFGVMADKIKQRTEALELSREEAREALEQYLEVLAFVAHELKSPIAGALTSLEVVEMGDTGELPEKTQRWLGKVRRYLDRGLEMAVNFTYLSRAESRGFTIKPSFVASLRDEIVTLAVADFADEAESREMPVSVEGDASVEVDASLMRIVLDNLVGNAVKYGEEGTPIDIRIEPLEGRVRVTVKNRGVGIAEDKYDEVFRKFSRIDDRRLRGRRGSGVGLYLSRLIVELHSGEVGLSGEYGEWVEFMIELPEALPKTSD